MISPNVIRAQFQMIFGQEPSVFSAPGRVNLIGEHTDYNDGFVLPMAIDRRTYVAAAPREDRQVRCASVGFDGQIVFDLKPDLLPASDWANYVRGVATCLLRAGFELRGTDLLIASDVPLGAGLSSSAALESAVGFALLKIADQPTELAVDLVALALAAQRAEQEFTGTQCGVMDQFIACLGIEGHALLIDCRSLEYEAVPVDLREARIVVCNSMVKHNLASGEYNKRRSECDEAVRRLAVYLPGIRSLRDVALGEFELYADSLPDVVRRRACHVVTENTRTLTAVEALKSDNLNRFGQLMYASHQSLQNDYDVSCRELDLLVDIAKGCRGVYGARMTGGGFGGCTVNLVASDQVENLIGEITERYKREIGLSPENYICQASDGVRQDG